MTYDTCSVCGAAISENNPDGVGFGCRANIVMPAAKDWRYKTHGLELWKLKCEVLMERFTLEFGQHKFRKEGFRKSFTVSIIAQWTERAVMSKKQFDIVLRFLEERRVYMQEDFTRVFKYWVRNYHPSPAGPEYDFYKERFAGYKKAYLSKRKGGKEENTIAVEEIETML